MSFRLTITAHFRWLILAALSGVASAASAGADLANGKALAFASTCTQCHGVDGNVRSTRFQPIPMLAGQPAAYLVQQMKDFAAGRRVSSTKNFEIMVEELSKLNEKEYEDIAAYYEGQKRY